MMLSPTLLANVMLALAEPEAGHAAGDAHAAHKPLEAMPAASEGMLTGIMAVVIFLVVFAVLAVKVWPTIAKGLDERAKKIKDEIDAAQQAKVQAKEALEQYQQSLAQARVEAQKEIDKARAQAQVIAAELKTKADAELGQMREKAMRDIEAAKRAAIAEVYSQTATLASTVAGKVLKRSINSGDTQSLVEESIRQLETAGR